MTTDAHELDARQQEVWRRAATGWARRQAALREKTAPVAQWLLDAVDPQPGERAIELAAGPGETGFMIAQRLGPSGRLLCTDQAPQMVDVARRRAAELGLDNVDFEVADAQRLEQPAEPFDAAVCRWGYMLMGDPDEALRRTHRALRDGGRLALATWDRPDRNLWMAAPVLALVSQGAMPPPDPAAPSPFSLFDPELIEHKLVAAGFDSIRTDRVEFTQRYPSLDEYWAETLDMAAPIAAVMNGLAADDAEAVREIARGTLGQFIGPEGRLEVPAAAVVASAVA